MLTAHLASQLVEIASTRVITQAIPSFHYRLGSGACQRSDRRKALQKPGIVVQHPAHLCLLQHELRHEDGIGITRFAPRKDACVARSEEHTSELQSPMYLVC